MSRISHKHKFIFFSFPKTGSESVRSILDPYSDIKAVTKSEITKENPFYSHITPNETKKIFESKGWNYNEYYKFTCVRNPYERLMSLYKMKYKTFDQNSFSKWVRTLRPNSKIRGDWYKNGIITFKNFISDPDGNVLVDEVIKLEEININLPILLNKFGIKIGYIPHINKGSVSGSTKKVSKKKSSIFKKNSQNVSLVFGKSLQKINLIDEKGKDFISKKYEWEIKEYGYNF